MGPDRPLDDSVVRHPKDLAEVRKLVGEGNLRCQEGVGTFAGGKFFGARGIFIQNMDSGDIQNYQLIDSNGVTRSHTWR